MKTLFKPTSYKKGAVWAVSATLVWKIISFANALLLALYFGANRQTDVYFYVIMLIGFAVAFLQRLNQTVLIPEAMFLTQENPSKARQFINMWLYVYAGVGLVVICLGALFPEKIWHLLSRFQGTILLHDKELLISGFILFALQIITYYLLCVAEMYKFFKTAWLGVLNAIFPLLFLLLFGQHVGIISMVYGFLAANIVQLITLLVLLRTQLQWDFAFTWVGLRTRTHQNMLTGQTLAILDMVNSLLPIYLISGMGAGLISALNYCKQFTDSTTEVFTARMANIAKIEMTEQTAQAQLAQANQTFLNGSYILLVLLAPLVVFSCYFAPEIVALFFKRGHFDATATQHTVCFLRPMLFTLLLAVPGYLQNSAIAAGQKIKEWFPYALTSGLIFTGLLIGGILYWGSFAYPYLIGAGLIIGFIINAFLFRKHFPFLQYTTPFWQVLRLTLMAGVALIPTVLLSHYLPVPYWVQILVCGTVFVMGYVGILWMCKDVKQLREYTRNGF